MARIPARVGLTCLERGDEKAERDDRPEDDHPRHQSQTGSQQDSRRPSRRRCRRAGPTESLSMAARRPRREPQRGTRRRAARTTYGGESSIGHEDEAEGDGPLRWTRERSILSSTRPCQSWRRSARPAIARASAAQIRRHGLVEDVPRVERDENGREHDFRDQQRDADLEALDRDEVEPGHECARPGDADGQERQLAEGHPDVERRQTSRTPKRSRKAPVARTGQPLRGDTSRLEDDLPEGAVECPERRRREHHRVPQRGRRVTRRGLSGRRLYTGAAGTASGSAPALGAGGRRFESGRPD